MLSIFINLHLQHVILISIFFVLLCFFYLWFSERNGRFVDWRGQECLFPSLLSLLGNETSKLLRVTHSSLSMPAFSFPIDRIHTFVCASKHRIHIQVKVMNLVSHNKFPELPKLQTVFKESKISPLRSQSSIWNPGCWSSRES